MAGAHARALTRGALAAALLAAAAAWAQERSVAAPVRFATVEEARAALVADDDWMAATSPFQRAAVAGRSGPVTLDAFKAVLARAARACDAQEQQRWLAAAAGVAPRLSTLGVPVPQPVTIVCTDGSDEAGAPYTRGSAIFLPQDTQAAGYGDAGLMAHEMVHVATRADPGLATRLYRELGFEPVAPLEWPPEWLPARIANPDAPHDRHAMRVDTPAGTQWLMPLLVAGRTRLQPGETFFNVLQVRLLAVDPGRAGQPTRPVRRGGQPLWWPVESASAYLQRLGGNTEYVFHPEETLADNIAFLATGRPVPNPALLDRLRAVLAGPARPAPHPESEKENRP